MAYDFALGFGGHPQCRRRGQGIPDQGSAPLIRPALVVGTLYLDVASAELVRLRFSFTAPSYLDRAEDISIVLENSLYEGRFWLPYRQEVEIRRRATWLDFPARGIIRGRWEISDYQLNPELPAGLFAFPEIGGCVNPAAKLCGPSRWRRLLRASRSRSIARIWSPSAPRSSGLQAPRTCGLPPGDSRSARSVIW